MNKLIISLVVSAPLLLAAPSFATSSSPLNNSVVRTNTTYSAANQLPKAGVNYAYWTHRNWHRNYHRGWRWHNWHYHRHYRW